MTKRIIIVICIMVMVSTQWVDGQVVISSVGELIIDNKNYTDLRDESFTFGTNIWHTRYIDHDIELPITEIWRTEKLHIKKGSNSTGQPIILEDIIIATSGDYVYVIDKESGRLILQNGNKGMRIQEGTSKNKSLYSSPLYLSNEDGWFNKDRLARIFIGTRLDGRMYCFKLDNNKQLIYEWHYETDIKDIVNNRSLAGIVSSPNILFDSNEGFSVDANKPVYIVFGNESGYLYILDARNGKVVVNGKNKLGNILSSSPITYMDANGTFSHIALGINNGGGRSSGLIHSGYVENYSFIRDNNFLEDQKSISYYGIPTSIAVISKGNSTNRRYLLFYSDKRANIYCYSESIYKREGETPSGLLFKIDRFNGLQSLNTPTIIDNKYAVFTLNSGGKAKVVCIDIDKGIEEGMVNSSKNANKALLWETSLSDSSGPAYIGATGISIGSNSGGSDIILVGDEGKDPEKPNLRAYYVGKAKNNTPVSADKAFFYEGENSINYAGGIHLTGGVKSEPAFADDIFVVMDGSGVIHAYSIKPKKNLAIASLDYVKDLLGNGVVRVKINSNFDKDVENVDIKMYHEDEVISKEKIDIPRFGTTIELDVDDEKINENVESHLTAKLNIEDRVVDELTFIDNIRTLKIQSKVKPELDIAVMDIEKRDYHMGIISPVRVKIKNYSDANLKDVMLTLSIDGKKVNSQRVNIGSNSDEYISFMLKTPSKARDFKLKAVINDDRKYEEINYKNNVLVKECSVKFLEAPKKCTNKVTWTETRFSHYNSKNEPIFKVHSYYSQLNATADVQPKSLKSGYGIELIVKSSLTHNYDKADKITGAQRVYAYFPEMDSYVKLEPTKDIKNHSNTWKLPINKKSVLKKRNHFIPVDWPDGVYPITIKIFDTASPGGKPCKILKINVLIDGHMYEDDVTS